MIHLGICKFGPGKRNLSSLSESWKNLATIPVAHIPWSLLQPSFYDKKKKKKILLNCVTPGWWRTKIWVWLVGLWPTQPSYCPAEQKLFKSLESLHCSINTLILRVRKRNSECLNDLPNFTRCWSQDLDTHIGLMWNLMPSPPYHAISQTYTKGRVNTNRSSGKLSLSKKVFDME